MEINSSSSDLRMVGPWVSIEARCLFSVISDNKREQYKDQNHKSFFFGWKDHNVESLVLGNHYFHWGHNNWGIFSRNVCNFMRRKSDAGSSFWASGMNFTSKNK